MTEILDVFGGYCVKRLPDGRCIHVMKMLYNWRVCRTDGLGPNHEFMDFDAGWCYQGTDLAALILTLTEAILWSGDDDTEPANYYKRAH